MNVTVSTNEIFFGNQNSIENYNPGVYVVEVRVWADNEYDTGIFEELTITIVDPCVTQPLTIDNSVFKTAPNELTMTQFVQYEALQITWDDSIVPEANILLCGPLVHSVTDMTSGSALKLSGDPFATNDLAVKTKTLNV